jgi:hypothetical protein
MNYEKKHEYFLLKIWICNISHLNLQCCLVKTCFAGVGILI